ncbi:hypothetical protein CHS0354_026373 [Potamilus streckersoni]|uniref:Uncharacterized protein n=1 Tax=Potamilus streckersoni TaxID=2493646 RepID=A0AAE0W728_9BIVA|nr:hypothetical protein CHS0354_026373 [Potamilus streckersoni]
MPNTATRDSPQEKSECSLCNRSLGDSKGIERKLQGDKAPIDFSTNTLFVVSVILLPNIIYYLDTNTNPTVDKNRVSISLEYINHTERHAIFIKVMDEPNH